MKDASETLSVGLYLVISEQSLTMFTIFSQSNVSSRKTKTWKKIIIVFLVSLSMNWKYIPGGKAFKINKKPKHTGILQTLKYVFLKIVLKEPKQIVVRIPSFIYEVPNQIRGNYFLATALMLCPPKVFVERWMPLPADGGLEAEGASHWPASKFKAGG